MIGTLRRLNGLVGWLAMLAVTTVLVMACGSGSNASADTPKPPGWRHISVPDDSGHSLYTFCDHGNRIYVTERWDKAAVAVAAADPSCAAVPR
jgi:hypothetical protein